MRKIQASRISKLIKKISELNNELSKEYKNAAKRYGFLIKKRKVEFLKSIRKKNRSFKIPTWKYVLPKNIRHLLSIPFIYVMILPAIILDIFLTIYNYTTIPLYKIPIVKRRDYINYDRRFLDYLNSIQKFNCLYCSYVNGLFAYAVEIAARTERYWCPIKAASKPIFHHTWYQDFADYGNPEEWKIKFNDANVFKSKNH